MKKSISDISPFKMYGNLYFVGSSRVSVHLIATSCGLIMIDSGFPDMYEQIIESIETLNFKPEDICAIFHSHGHIDHFGCTNQFKSLSGAKTYISRIDNEIANGTLELSWARELGINPIKPFNADVLIEDGDCYTFGNTKIRCVLTPGHTEGVLSFFVNIEENGKSVIAAMHGGIGTNSMTKDFLNQYNLSFDCRDKFRQGLHSLAKERVDLVMGNHPEQNDTYGKLKEVISDGKIKIDPTEWQRFLLKAEKQLDKLIEEEYKKGEL